MGEKKRSEKILAELKERYGLEDRFIQKLTPILEIILSDSFSDEERLPLLEELAATCQRDQVIRKTMGEVRKGVDDLFSRLREMVLRMHRGG